MSMLEVKDLQVYYGVIQALKGISFEVEQGDVVALIGANGAGKTTTLHTITGLLPSKAGNITFEGTDITHVPGYKLVSMGIAHVPEGRRVFASLTVLQNLKMGAYTRNDKKEIEDTIPASERAQEPACRNFVRRRAADACDGTRPHEPPALDRSRRAVDGSVPTLC